MPPLRTNKRPGRYLDEDEDYGGETARARFADTVAENINDDTTNNNNNNINVNTSNENESDPDDPDGDDDEDDATRVGMQSTPVRQETHAPPLPVLPIPPQPVNTIGLAAAIARLYPHGVPEEIYSGELEWQGTLKPTAASIKAFRSEILMQQGLLVFAFMQPEDITISLMHSPATYSPRGDTGALSGKDIGFVGDRTAFSSPIPIILQKDKPWKWVNIEADFNDSAHDYYYSIEANAKNWYPPTALLTKELIPRLILLPSHLVEYCAAVPRTPWQLWNHIVKMLAMEPDTTVAKYELLQAWCMAASHGQNGSSVLSYSLEAAHSNTATYQQWVRLRLDATLGPMTAAPPYPSTALAPTMNHQQLTNTSTLAAVAAEFGKGVLAAINPAGGTALVPGLTTPTATAGDGKTYDAYHYAVLQGFSNTPTKAGLQPIWGLFTQTKTMETHRLHIREAMRKWARRFSVNIHRGLLLSKNTIESIMHLRFNPSGGVAYFSSAEKGVSILTCQPMPGEDRETSRDRELAAELSGANLTFDEALSLGKHDPRAPPATYQDLKATVGTFCALLHTLFGPGCDYYLKCFELYTCLDSDKVSENYSKFTPLLCRQIIWAILDDGREYFNNPLMPDDFAVPLGTIIKYPKSELDEFFHAVKIQTPIIIGSFPDQWQPRPERPTRTPAIPPGVPLASSGVPLTVSGSSSVAGSTHTGASSLTGATSGSRTPTIQQTNIHPKIKAAMGPFITRVGRLQISRIMALASVTWNDMPKLPAYLDGDTNKLCYNFVLGKCNPKYCTHKTGHASSTDVTDEFAEALCTILQPGMNDMTPELARIPWTEFKAIAASRNPTRE